MPSWFCNFQRTFKLDKVKRSRELLKWKWGIFGSSLRKFCLSNFRELAKKILVSFTFGFAMQIFGFPRFSTITILFCNCLGPRNTRRISTFAAKISLWRKKPENGNNFEINYFKSTLFGNLSKKYSSGKYKMNRFKEYINVFLNERVSSLQKLVTYLLNKLCHNVIEWTGATIWNKKIGTVVCIKVRTASFPRFWKNHP